VSHYRDTYDMRDYPNFLEHGGLRECDGRPWAYVQIDNAPEASLGWFSQQLGEWASLMSPYNEVRLNSSGANMLLMWTRRDSGPMVSEAQVTLYKGEAAAGVKFAHWSGGR